MRKKLKQIICNLSHSSRGESQHKAPKDLSLKKAVLRGPKIGEVCKMLSRVTFLIRNLKGCINVGTVTAFHDVFHSHLPYGLMLWGHELGSSLDNAII